VRDPAPLTCTHRTFPHHIELLLLMESTTTEEEAEQWILF